MGKMETQDSHRNTLDIVLFFLLFILVLYFAINTFPCTQFTQNVFFLFNFIPMYQMIIFIDTTLYFSLLLIGSSNLAAFQFDVVVISRSFIS